MFSSQIWTKRSKPAPFTLDTGDREVVVAWEASIAVRVGSMSAEVGRVAVKVEVDDEAARTASMARAKATMDCIVSVPCGTVLL